MIKNNNNMNLNKNNNSINSNKYSKPNSIKPIKDFLRLSD